MKNLIILLIGICLVLINCKSLDIKNNNFVKKKNVTNKKLDEKIINSLPLIGGKIINDTIFFLGENSTIKDNIFIRKYSYTYIAKPINKNIQKISVYYEKTLTLKSEGQLFVTMPIGTYKFYDEERNLEKEINYDKGFENFTINDLLIKVKKEFEIDLNDNIAELSVSREIGKEDKIPIYVISIPAMPKIRFIKINGITGNIISDKLFDDLQWGNDM